MLVRLIAIWVVLSLAMPVMASDLEKEQRWREQVADSIMDGEAVDVIVDGREVFGIYTAAEEVSDKGMIVVHGTGIHPNWDQVVQPVRVGMTEQGWHTLSIQMPVLANDADYEDYVPLYPNVPARLKAAEAFLLDKGISTIVIVAHSQGATMSSYYLARNDSKVKALVAIGMGAAQKHSDVNSAESLKNISIPVLDLYGSDDLPAVLETAERRKAASAHNSAYSQQVVEGANHFFDDFNDELIELLASWLEQI